MRSALYVCILAAFPVFAPAYGQGPITLADAMDIKAFKAFNLFMEVCILGRADREGRLATLDKHPGLQRMPVPTGSAADRDGRLIWGSPPDILVALDADLKCQMVVSDPSLRDRLDKIIQGIELGKSGTSQGKFKPIVAEAAILETHRTNNILLRPYVLELPNSKMGVRLVLQTSIEDRPGTPAVRLSAAYFERE